MIDLLRRLIAAFATPAARVALAAVVTAGVGASDAIALPQDAETEESPAEAVMQIPDDEAVARGSDTPRNASFTFIVLCRDGDWVDAADMLEPPASGWPEGVPPTRIARALKSVLDHRLWIDFASVPGVSANAPGAPDRVTIGVIDTPETVLEVEMIRVDERWIFAASTVQGVPEMARAIGVWWVSALPEFMVDVRVAEIELWQWIGIVAIACAGLLVGWGLTWLLRHGILSMLGPAVAPLILILTPLAFLLSVLGMRIAQPLLVLSAPARENLSLGSRAALVFAIAWLVVRWIRVVSMAVEAQMAKRGITDGVAIIRMFRGAAIAVVWLLGVAASLQIFGLDLSTVIAGLGIGTAAIALASQQTLANLFGGASVVADQVLNVGDTCMIDGKISTVERIGVRSTQLRTADRTLLVVANGDLAQARIEKLSARDGFRHVATLGLRYETSPDTMLAIVADLEQRLKEEPLVDPKSAMAHFTGFGESSLNVEVRAMFRTLDMPAYRAAVQRLNADFMRIVARHGSGFAFPSRTVYMTQDAGIGRSVPAGR
ncbi:MAG: mechanosensitive ion channel family protein [Phycisphaerales bacterium]|nr:mechanosensitive ion channel family protein [Phycisphaerales bacterium]